MLVHFVPLYQQAGTSTASSTDHGGGGRARQGLQAPAHGGGVAGRGQKGRAARPPLSPSALLVFCRHARHLLSCRREWAREERARAHAGESRGDEGSPARAWAACARLGAPGPTAAELTEGPGGLASGRRRLGAAHGRRATAMTAHGQRRPGQGELARRQEATRALARAGRALRRPVAVAMWYWLLQAPRWRCTRLVVWSRPARGGRTICTISPPPALPPAGAGRGGGLLASPGQTQLCRAAARDARNDKGWRNRQKPMRHLRRRDPRDIDADSKASLTPEVGKPWSCA